MEREMSNLQIVTALLNILAVYSLFSFKVKKINAEQIELISIRGKTFHYILLFPNQSLKQCVN